jgi:hypothetical protein
MKAVISSALHRLASFFRKAGSPLRRIGAPLRTAGGRFSKIGPVFGKVGSLFSRIGYLFRRVGSWLKRLIRRLWLLPPFQRIDRAFHGTRKEPERLRYRFLPYLMSVLRVLGWVVLIVGVLASIVLGWEIVNGGVMVWETELRGVGIGVSAIVLGVIGSFLGWLLLLVARELVCLFIHVKENTRSTAESMTE